MTGSVEVKPFFRPSSPAGIADAAFEAFRRAPVALTAISVIVNVPLMASIAALLVFVRDRGYSWGSVSYFAVLAILSLAVAGSAWLRALGTGALAHAAVEAIASGEASALRSLLAAVRSSAILGVIAALRLGAVVAGAVLCVFPGALAFGALALAPHAALLEDLGVTEAMMRSTRLAPRAAGGLLASTLLAVILLVIGFIELLLFAQLGTGVIGSLAPSVPTAWLARPETAWIALAITKILSDPILSCATALTWVDARIRTEGLDLELRSQVLAGEPLSIAPAAQLKPAAS